MAYYRCPEGSIIVPNAVGKILWKSATDLEFHNKIYTLSDKGFMYMSSRNVLHIIAYYVFFKTCKKKFISILNILIACRNTSDVIS
jgi:hypothetical protein